MCLRRGLKREDGEDINQELWIDLSISAHLGHEPVKRSFFGYVTGRIMNGITRRLRRQSQQASADSPALLMLRAPQRCFVEAHVDACKARFAHDPIAMAWLLHGKPSPADFPEMHRSTFYRRRKKSQQVIEAWVTQRLRAG